MFLWRIFRLQTVIIRVILNRILTQSCERVTEMKASRGTGVIGEPLIPTCICWWSRPILDDTFFLVETIQSRVQTHEFCTMFSKYSELHYAFGDVMPASVTSHGCLHPFLVGISGLITVYSVHSFPTTGFLIPVSYFSVSSHM